MECPACSVSALQNGRFCENCGAELPQACPSCNFASAPTAKFCGGCGLALERAVSVSVPAASKPSLAGWGELKQATVLFADIDRSTEQIANLDPEAAMDRLQPAVLAMCKAVERFGGTVIRTLGDGVMALFGVPIALEGHATLACEAALQMRSVFTDQPGDLTIRVGLHSGLVASDPYTADKSKGGGAHGLTIHLASRVMSVAPPGQITLTADCHALLRGRAKVQSLGWCPLLKGIPGPVGIYLLLALKNDFANRQFHDAKLTPLRGREREILALQDSLGRAQQAAGNVVGITGAPGTGKSRLCFEFGQWCRKRGVPVFDVHAQLYGHATPLQPALELLRVFFFQLEAGTEPLAARRIVSSRMEQAGIVDEADAALVHEFLGIASADSTPAQLNPTARRGRLLSIVRDLFEQLAATHALLIIEDLHWLDEASEEFISVLVKAVAGTRVLLVLNYRSSYVPSSTNLHHFQKIELAELSSGDTAALVRELVSNRRELSDLYELIARRSGGNPFFAEELVYALAESGILSSDAVASGTDAGTIDTALPSTVQAVIAARIDRLGGAEKSLLQTCAIIGKEFPLGVLALVTGSSADTLRAVLDRLYHAQLIQPGEGARHFAFRHTLIQEVAYNTQLKSRRSSIHAAVAGAMTSFYAEQLDEYAALIAYHFSKAGANLKAAGYESRAAQWVGAVDSARAIKHWHRVRSLLDSEASAPEHSSLRMMANGKIIWLGWREGLSFPKVKPYIDEAMALAEQFDTRWMQLLLMVEGRILQGTGASVDLYVERVEKGLALLAPAGQRGRAVTLNTALSQAYGWAGLLYEALAANDAAMQDIQHVDQFDLDFIGYSIEQWLLGMRGRLLSRLGRFDEARQCLERLLKLSASSIDPVINQMPHYGFVELASHTGDIALAEEHLSAAVEIAHRHQTPYLLVFALNGQALVNVMRGEHLAATCVLGEALALVRDAGVAMEFETEILANLAESHRCAQNLKLALAVSKETVQLSRQRGNRLPEYRALITWASTLAVDAALGLPGEEQELLESANLLARVTGAQSYENASAAACVPASLTPAQLAPAT